jgi:hypothetical protein
MTNSNKIYFITSPLGQYNGWCLDKIETLFHYDDNNKIYFRFGTLSRLDLETMYNHYDRISLIINDQISNFHNTNFFYYGWEILPCLDELYKNFPGSEFLLAINNLDDMPYEISENKKRFKLKDPKFIAAAEATQKEAIKNFVKDKIYTARVRERKSENGDIERSITTYHLKN